MWSKRAIGLWLDGICAEDILEPAVSPRVPSISRPLKRKRYLSDMSTNRWKHSQDPTALTPCKTPKRPDTPPTVVPRRGTRVRTPGLQKEADPAPRAPPPQFGSSQSWSTGDAFSTAPTLFSPVPSKGSPASSSEPELPAKPTSKSNSRSGSSIVSGSKTPGGTSAKPKQTPNKGIAERNYAKDPVLRYPIDGPGSINKQIRDAVTRITDIGRGKGILSQKHAAWVPTIANGDKYLAKDLLDDEYDEFGVAPDLDGMRRIVERAKRNALRCAAEPGWNSGVHNFLIDAAYLGSCVSRHLVWENTTTANIIPEFLPEIDDTRRADGKRVDFCVALEFHDSYRLGRRIFGDGIHYLNHTDYEALRYSPICVSMETKLDGESGTAALLQIITFGSAQMKFLEKMLCETHDDDAQYFPAIPPLPLLVIQGHSWSLSYLEQDLDGEGATLWECGEFGNTRSLAGAYQIVAALHVLMDWSVKVYKPWFLKNILAPRGIFPKDRPN